MWARWHSGLTLRCLDPKPSAFPARLDDRGDHRQGTRWSGHGRRAPALRGERVSSAHSLPSAPFSPEPRRPHLVMVASLGVGQL